jgi:hypothetical protein
MKCPRCFSLNCATDTVCVGCRTSLTPARQAEAREKAKASTPGWAYLFAAACGAIPIITLGGAIPTVIGLGGAGLCLQVARSYSLPGAVRFVACFLIAATSWVVFAEAMMAMFPQLKHHLQTQMRKF